MNPFDILYPYQKDAVSSALADDKGIVCMPTGVGKTFCQASMIANDIKTNPNEFRMYVVNAPRIMLTYQLLNEIYGFLIKSDIEARYMFVHSGGGTDEKELELVRKDSDIPFSEIGSSVNVRGIQSMMVKARKQNLPLIMLSTYHSAEKIEIARAQLDFNPISMIVNDEAHYLVQEQFHDILNTLTSDSCYFFTATTIHTPSDDGRGMNNVDAYGEELYTMIPREAIELGKMVRPRLHIVKTDDVHTLDDYNRSLNKIIVDTFYQHEEVLSKQNPKVLISTKGTQDIIEFLRSAECTEIRNAGVEVYAVASHEDVGNRINGETYSRAKFLRKLKKDGNNPKKKLIVLHYDILTEGIDVSGFTGIMPLRTLSKSKFLQTFGRSARLDPVDRKRIEDGEIQPNDLDMMNKPYAYVMIPNIVHSNEDDRANLTQIVKELRSFGFKPYENIILTERGPHGAIKKINMSGLNDVARRLPNVGELIENLEMELEAEESAKLSKADLLKKEFDL